MAATESLAIPAGVLVHGADAGAQVDGDGLAKKGLFSTTRWPCRG